MGHRKCFLFFVKEFLLKKYNFYFLISVILLKLFLYTFGLNCNNKSKMLFTSNLSNVSDKDIKKWVNLITFKKSLIIQSKIELKTYFIFHSLAFDACFSSKICKYYVNFKFSLLSNA